MMFPQGSKHVEVFNVHLLVNYYKKY